MTDENVQQRVSLLRKALKKGSDQEYVETLRGFGYRLGFMAQSMEPDSVDDSKPLSRRLRPLRILALALVIIVLLMGIAALALSLRNLKRAGMNEIPSVSWAKASTPSLGLAFRDDEVRWPRTGPPASIT